MFWVISLVLLLSCAIDCGFANNVGSRIIVATNSSDVHEIVTDLDEAGRSIIIIIIIT